MDITILQPLLPDFISWARLEKDSNMETARKQVYILRLIFRTYPLFNLENCRDFVLHSKDTKKASTIEKYIHAIRVFCDFLMWRGMIKENWGKSIPIPKRDKNVPTILTSAEIELLLNCSLSRTYGHSPNPELSKMVFDTILSILAKTGSRLGEVLGMKIKDINLTEDIWTLNETKTRTGRLIPIPPDLNANLRTIIGDRKPDDNIFLNPINGKPIRHHQLENNFRLRLKKCGITKPAIVHTLRHSFITELLRQDVSVLKVAMIVGHDNIKTTQDYARLLTEDLRMAMMRLPLNAKYCTTDDVLTHIKQTFETFHLKNDGRFNYSVEEGPEGIRIDISVKD